MAEGKWEERVGGYGETERARGEGDAGMGREERGEGEERCREEEQGRRRQGSEGGGVCRESSRGEGRVCGEGGVAWSCRATTAGRSRSTHNGPATRVEAPKSEPTQDGSNMARAKVGRAKEGLHQDRTGVVAGTSESRIVLDTVSPCHGCVRASQFVCATVCARHCLHKYNTSATFFSHSLSA